MLFAMRQCRPFTGGHRKRLIMDSKLALLFVLIASVIALSHLNDDTLGRLRRQFASRSWREFMPARRKS